MTATVRPSTSSSTGGVLATGSAGLAAIRPGPRHRTLCRLRPPSRLWLAAIMVGAGVVHFVAPGPYARIVPRALGNPRLYVYASGAAEIVAGTLLALPRTRRVGGWTVAAILVVVFPANVQAALDGGVLGGRPAFDSALAGWLRLPLQAPLVWWALAEARRAREEAGRGAHGAPSPR